MPEGDPIAVEKRRLLSPRFLVLIGVIFTSSSAILIRLSDAPPLATAAYRMAFSALIVLPSLVWSNRHSRNPVAEPFFRRIRFTDIMLCLASGFFLALHFGTWITSLSYTTIASATVLVSTHPIFIMAAGALLLHERPTRMSIALVILAFAGSIFLGLNVGSSGGGSFLGNSLAFAGAAAFSGYILIGRVVRGRLGTMQYTFIVYLSAAFLLIIACVIGGVPMVGLSARDYLIFVALAVFPTLLGHSIFSWALRYLRPTFISVAILGEPISASILAVFIFHEIPTLTTVAGGVVVIGAIAAYLRHDEQMSRKASQDDA